MAIAAALAMLALTAVASAETSIPGTRPVNLRQTTLPESDIQAATPRDGDPLLPFTTESGLISLSVDGIGTNNPAGAPIMVHKNVAGATVRKAYLFAASTGFSGYTPVNGDVTIDGTPVEWNPANTISNDIFSVNVEADVTNIVKEKINKAPAGNLEFNVAEPNNTFDLDGEILAVILNDPSVKHTNSVTLLYGAQNPEGDSFHVGLAEPVNKSNPEFALNLSLGISYGYQTQFETSQFSIVHANGKLLTQMAGGQDDCFEKYSATPNYPEGCPNGTLITVGGIGDSTNDPNPNETLEECADTQGEPVARCDDELYSLLPFVSNGETELSFETDNPSDNDNIFFAALETHANAAVVGEGITLAPTAGTNKVGQTHTLTATVQNEKGAKIAGKLVHFDVVSGPNAGLTGEETTNASGEAKFAYKSSVAGVDHIVATFENAESETETSNEVTETWETEITVEPEPTQLSTSLSGGGQSGGSISVNEGTVVKDSATLSGNAASDATGTVTYKVYSDSECTNLVTEAGSVAVAGTAVPSSNGEKLAAGTYYWQASYGGDTNNKASTSTCGSEVETVTPVVKKKKLHGPALDGIASAQHYDEATAELTTKESGDLILAFVAADSPYGGGQTSTVSGGGLTWTLVGRDNEALGDAEIWEARATGPLTNDPITATANVLSPGSPFGEGYDETITVAGFKNAPGIGPVATFASPKGAPLGTLTTTQAKTWVWAIGDDWLASVPRKAPNNQKIWHEATDHVGDTYWVQSTKGITNKAGKTVKINDPKPNFDPFDLVLVDIL